MKRLEAGPNLIYIKQEYVTPPNHICIYLLFNSEKKVKKLTQDTRTPSPGGRLISTGTLPVSNSKRTTP